MSAWLLRRGASPTGNAIPAWYAAMTDKTWSQIGTNTIRSVLPSPIPPGTGPEYITDGWNGAWVDPVRMKYGIGPCGGHTDYGGNEQYEFDPYTLLWTRVTNPSDTSGGSDAADSAGVYGDGLPRSTHTNNMLIYANGAVWLCGLPSMHSAGNRSRGVFRCDVGTRAWTNLGKDPTTNSSWGNEGSCAYDSVNKTIWVCYQFADVNYFSIDTTNNTMTAHSGAINHGYNWSAIDPVKRCWIVGGVSLGIRVLNIDNPSAGWYAPTVTGSPSQTTAYSGGFFHAASNAVLCWNGDGANVIKLAIPSDPFGGTYTWSSVSPDASNTYIPTPATNSGNATLSRWNYLPIGNGVIVHLKSIDSQVDVYKMPAGGL